MMVMKKLLIVLLIYSSVVQIISLRDDYEENPFEDEDGDNNDYEDKNSDRNGRTFPGRRKNDGDRNSNRGSTIGSRIVNRIVDRVGSALGVSTSDRDSNRRGSTTGSTNFDRNSNRISSTGSTNFDRNPNRGSSNNFDRGSTSDRDNNRRPSSAGGRSFRYDDQQEWGRFGQTCLAGRSQSPIDLSTYGGNQEFGSQPTRGQPTRVNQRVGQGNQRVSNSGPGFGTTQRSTINNIRRTSSGSSSASSSFGQQKQQQTIEKKRFKRQSFGQVRIELDPEYYRQQEVTIKNTGHTVEAEFEGRNRPSIRVNGRDDFNLEQLHFHWGRNDGEGSEHTLSGRRFPLEMHLVHWNRRYGSFRNAQGQDNGLLVMAVFFTTGRSGGGDGSSSFGSSGSSGFGSSGFGSGAGSGGNRGPLGFGSGSSTSSSFSGNRGQSGLGQGQNFIFRETGQSRPSGNRGQSFGGGGFDQRFSESQKLNRDRRQSSADMNFVIRSLDRVRVANATTRSNMPSLSTMLPSQLSAMTYEGSLTTPPCTERVTWIIFDTPSLVASSQLQRLRSSIQDDEGKVLTFNFRRTQPLNGRRIGGARMAIRSF